MSNRADIVLAYSGGIDSTVLLWQLRADGHTVACLTVNYGQSHAIETERARHLAREAGAAWALADLRPVAWLFAGSVLTGDSNGGLVVPNRNMVLLSLATAWAEQQGIHEVAFAVQAGDAAVWPDCRTIFAEEMFRAIRQATSYRVHLRYPFIRMPKVDVIRCGLALNVPLDRTWSCYGPGPEPCDECLACVARREAFFLAGAMPA